MLISTEAGSGEIVSARDDTRFYDDLGCLAADWPSHAAGAVAYVQLAGGGWHDAERAWFAQPSSARTPMGSGYAAYATADEARAVDRQGRALTWNEIVKAAGVRP